MSGQGEFLLAVSVNLPYDFRMGNKFKFFVLFGGLFFQSAQVLAAYSNYIGAVTTGTAGAGRAAVEATEAPTLNPATISFMRGYFFASTYASFQDAQQASVSFVDNLPDTVMPAALSYSQINSNVVVGQDLITQDLRLAVGNFMSEATSVGVGFHQKVDSLFATKYTQLNMQIGTLWTINPELGLAMVFDNIINQDTKVPNEYRLNPATSIGINYNYRKFMRIKLDIETAKNNSLDLPSVSTGIETYWNRWFIVRMGAHKDMESNVDQFGFGFGFVGPKFALHYGYLSSPQQEKLTRHAVDLAIPIW